MTSSEKDACIETEMLFVSLSTEMKPFREEINPAF